MLGALILEPSTYLSAADIIDKPDFFIVRHGYIWEAFSRLDSRSEPADYITIVQELRDMGQLEEIGGEGYITQLVNNVPTSMHAEVYAELILRTSKRRQYLQAADNIRSLALNSDISIDIVAEKAEKALVEVGALSDSQGLTDLASGVSKEYDKLEQIRDGKVVFGIPMGFRALDIMLGGLNKSDLLIFAGRPGMGKTSWMLTVALNVARKGARVAIFTMEMGVEQIIRRFLSIESSVTIQQMRTGNTTDAEWHRLTQGIGRLYNLPIYIDDTPGITPAAIRSKCRKMQYEVGVDLVIIDYMQLMESDNNYRDNRVQQISYISRALKNLARELKCTVLSAAQLNRNVEQRGNKRPMLADLRESGCLSGDTQIYLPDKGYSVPIKSLVGKTGFNVLSMDTETYKLENGTVTNAFTTGMKPVYKMVTALGRTIRATGNHKFLTINGWKRLDELEIDGHIAIPRILPDIHSDDRMKDSELALMAHLIGDGCTLPRHSIQYTTGKHDLAKIVSDLATEVFGDLLSPRIEKANGHNWYNVYLASTKRLSRKTRSPISTWLEGYGIWGLRSYEKHIPENVFGQSNEKVALFLSHLWATDGCVNLSKAGKRYRPIIFYSTSSPRLARDVRCLLLRLGMNGRLRVVSQGDKGRDQYHVILTGHGDLSLFADVIDTIGKKQSLDMESVKTYLDRTTSNTNRDIIPHDIWRKYVVPSMQRNGVTSRDMKDGKFYLGTTFYKQNVSRDRARRLSETVGSTAIRNLANSDIYWDKISSIGFDGEEPVYDLTVDTYHNFCAGLIMAHNSIEQDADAVMFLYRDEVYHPESTDKPNIGEVIVSKHRHGNTGTVELLFDAPTMTFRDAEFKKIDTLVWS